MAATLFDVTSADIGITSDDAYTPRWVFDAMGLEFDLDVASPLGGPWHVPAARYYTAADDGLVQPWDGLVWCNPPFSSYEQWCTRWAAHDRGVLMGLTASRQPWRDRAFAAADAVAFCNVIFERPGRKPLSLYQASFIAFRGVGVGPAERLAAADKHGAVLYGRAGSES